MITRPGVPDGIEWSPLDASSAAQSLKSSRSPVEYSPAHPIIASIRGAATLPPGLSYLETLSLGSWLTIECRCGTVWPVQKMDVRKAIRRGQALYCSPECMAQTFSTTNRTRFCQCGTPIPRSRKSTCSDDCARRQREARKTPKACPQCGAEFLPISSRHTYCCRDCANLAHSRRMVGQGNSHFKTGTSYAKWFRSMRPLILWRDGNCCVVCKQAPTVAYMRGGKQVVKSGLVIHHINEDPRDNTPENLVTLCHHCHMTHHKSRRTPYGWFGKYAVKASRSMTSKWQVRVTSLRTAYSSTTA